MFLIKNDEGRYLHQDATMENPFWGSVETAMRIRHQLGARAIQEKTGGTVFEVDRKGTETEFQSQAFKINGEVEVTLAVEIVQILATAEGFKLNLEEVESVVKKGDWSSSSSRLRRWLNTTTRILNKTEDILNK